MPAKVVDSRSKRVSSLELVEDEGRMRVQSDDVRRAQAILDVKETVHQRIWYRPHTISVLLIALVVLAYHAFREDESLEHNVKWGICGAIFAFLIFCAIQLRDTTFSRPHPAVWRFITGVAVLYLVFLVFLLFQNVHDARQLFKYMYPELGTPLPERSYGDDCRIYTPEKSNIFANLWNTINDEFVLAHLLGWWGKAVMLRDFYLCWLVSILFELMELSLKHMLHNFNECWWDQIIIDILVCNAIGIWAGLKTCRWLELREYNWSGMPKINQKSGYVKRILHQFTPEKWDQYRWEMFSSLKRFLYTLALLTILLMVEIMSFYLKFILWIPPRNLLNTYRLILWFSFGIPAAHEFYQFVSDKNCKKLGTMCWLTIANLTIETLICIKFGRGMFPAPHPPAVVYSWSAVIVFLVLWMIYYFGYRRWKKSSSPHPAIEVK